MAHSNTGRTFRAALVQLCSGRNVDRNIADAVALIREAAAGGADYVQTPEVTTLMELETAKLFAAVEPEEGNRALAQFQALAKELQTLAAYRIDAGQGCGRQDRQSSLPAAAPTVASRRPTTRSICSTWISPVVRATVKAKITSRANGRWLPGLPWGGLGLSICYDLRFPHLYRVLAKSGAKFLAVPAAFTKVTGEAHWHTLLRARAIECQCFVFAAAQGGRHEHGRDTFGHSLIISPWGQILAEGGVQPSVIFADIDLQAVEDARSRVPSLGHDRPFTVENRSGA